MLFILQLRDFLALVSDLFQSETNLHGVVIYGLGIPGTQASIYIPGNRPDFSVVHIRSHSWSSQINRLVPAGLVFPRSILVRRRTVRLILPNTVASKEAGYKVLHRGGAASRRVAGWLGIASRQNAVRPIGSVVSSQWGRSEEHTSELQSPM